MKIGGQVFRAVLDTGATLSIVARRLLKTFKKTKTVAIRVGDARTIQSLGGVDVTICLDDETVTQHCRVLDTDAFDIVIGTDFLRRNPQVKMLSLQQPYSLHCWSSASVSPSKCSPSCSVFRMGPALACMPFHAECVLWTCFFLWTTNLTTKE